MRTRYDVRDRGESPWPAVGATIGFVSAMLVLALWVSHAVNDGLDRAAAAIGGTPAVPVAEQLRAMDERLRKIEQVVVGRGS